MNVTRHFFGVLAFAAGLLMATSAQAALQVQTVAPDFTAQAARGGDVSAFDLRSALARGPVVLYFFPKAFTSGCTIEAHAFAEHTADFKQYHATVIGVSGDNIATQKRFSTQACRAQFLVASDPGLKIARSYDATVLGIYANRVSYVIATNGKIVETFTDFAPLAHIDNALQALRRLLTKRPLS